VDRDRDDLPRRPAIIVAVLGAEHTGAVVAVAALAEVLGYQRSARERCSSVPLFADEASGPMVSRAQVGCCPAFRDEPGSTIEERRGRRRHGWADRC
jgi:hypothetical protein